MADYKAVIWDFGGVITSSPFEAFNRYEAAKGLPENFIRTLNATNSDTNAWARFERSEISAGEFDAAFRTESLAAGHDVPGAMCWRFWPVTFARNSRRAGWAEGAQLPPCLHTNNVKTGNDDAPNPGMAREPKKAAQVADVMARFELVIESSVEGVENPIRRFINWPATSWS